MSTEPPPLDQPSGYREWHYAMDGERLGPAGEAVVRKLIERGVITGDTKVWSEGLTEWKEARLTSLAPFFGTKPPELTGDSVSNLWAWVLAFLPLVFGVVRYQMDVTYLAKVLDAPGVPQERPNYTLVMCLNIAANLYVAWCDSKSLKLAGQNTRRFRGWLWFVPVYLFVRAKTLKQSQGPFIVWLVLFLLFIFY